MEQSGFCDPAGPADESLSDYAFLPVNDVQNTLVLHADCSENYTHIQLHCASPGRSF